MLLLLTVLSGMVHAEAPANALATSFQNPPASSRPHTWWHWMDGNITKEGITADLRAMKSAGIGGAHIFDVGQGVPSGPIVYNSPEWRDLMVHALREAKKLGLDMTMHNCAGWSSSAGPWVKPEDAMKKVVFATATVPGGGKPTLPKPQINGGYYRDIAIQVLPTRELPGKSSLGTLTGLGPNPGAVTTLDWPAIDSATSVPLDRIRPDGTLDFDLPSGDWTILRMGETLTGAQNVASRDSGRGLEVDKLSAASLDRFLEGGLKPLLDQLGTDSALHTVLIDSYETGYNNWTPGMLQEFAARRGYDATPYLPSLAGYVVGTPERTLGFLFDYRRTIAELWAKNYSGHFAKRLKERGLNLAIEPYGNGNFDPFTFGKPANLIMGEYWVGDSQINPSVKHAASVAHVYGHSVVGAEALTATPEQAGWRNQPRQWKPYADHAMTLGINRVIYHRFAHQPWVNNVLPGMTMGPWGSHVDRGNTIWPYMATWNTYLSRCQYLLQQGKFVGDILLFTGEDSPQSYAGEGQTLPEMPAGYDYDFCGRDPLMSLTVKNGRLVLPNGASYAVLALPQSTRMSLPLLNRIKNLVAQGATVIGPRPNGTPSLSEALKGGEASVAQIAREVWGQSSGASGRNKFGKGTVVWGKSVGDVLKGMGVTPDFLTATKGVRAIHRRIGEAEAYFVASTQPYPHSATAKFRTSAKNVRVELWHPETGQIEEAPVWRQVAGAIEVPLTLESDGSVFVMITPTTRKSIHLTSTKATPAVVKKQVEPPLRILKAVYGDASSGKTIDVTAIVAAAAGPHSLRIVASNTDMGGDPAFNIVKSLVVTYKLGDEVKTVVIRENAKLEIGNLPNSGTPPVFEVRGRNAHIWQNGDFSKSWSNGSSVRFQVRDVPQPVALKGPWSLKFPSGWDAPATATYNKLESWTESKDFGIKHFSGTVAYSAEFGLSRAQLRGKDRLYLDLGDVRELCRIRLNGKLIATQWKPPFRVDITDSARVGQNKLEVEVTNLWVNRLIGDEQFPDDMGWNGSQLKGWPDWFVKGTPRPEPRRKTFTTWRHNYKDTPLLPSGLLGPVMLRWVRVVPLAP